MGGAAARRLAADGWQVAKLSSSGRYGTSGEVAELIAFLVSDKGRTSPDRICGSMGG